MTEKRPEFVNRERELAELRALSERPGPQMALLYGRRRVGKTFLLDRAWRELQPFYFLAADTTAERNRRDLLRELSLWSGDEIPVEDYPNWRTLFRLLASLAADQPLVVVLDEFQYLMESEEGVVSQLTAIWDREVGNRDLTLVLCGSEVSTMSKLQAGDSPLYGRLNWMHRLRALDYRDAARFFPGRDERAWAYLYGIVGGVPRYLTALGVDEPPDEAVARTFLSPRGEIHLQMENLIEQERGIREPAAYRAVLDAVARGNTETNEIAQAAGLQDNPIKARRALETLEELELIERERNFGAGNRAAWHNRIADPALRFWYRFVHPNRSRLQSGDPLQVWRESVAPYLDDYMGKVFEELCRQGLRRYGRQWGYADIAEWGRWEGQDRNRRSIEIDLVARLTDKKILVGEVKWSSSPIDIDVHFRLRRNLEDLSISGQGWAKAALSEAESAGFLYVSAAGFTDAFQQRANEDSKIRLVTLEDLYR